MGKPITEKELAGFVGTEFFKDADRIRGLSIAWGTGERDRQFWELKAKALEALEITMQVQGYYRIDTIRKYEASLEYHLKNRAGITMSYKEICELTADRNPDGTPIL